MPNRALKGRIWALDQNCTDRGSWGRCREQEQPKAFPLQGFSSFTKDKDRLVQGMSCYSKRKTLLDDFMFPARMQKRPRTDPAACIQLYCEHHGATSRCLLHKEHLQGKQWPPLLPRAHRPGDVGRFFRTFSHLQHWLLPWRPGSGFHGLPVARKLSKSMGCYTGVVFLILLLN